MRGMVPDLHYLGIQGRTNRNGVAVPHRRYPTDSKPACATLVFSSNLFDLCHVAMSAR